jgi:hypothetical protein
LRAPCDVPVKAITAVVRCSREVRGALGRRG